MSSANTSGYYVIGFRPRRRDKIKGASLKDQFHSALKRHKAQIEKIIERNGGEVINDGNNFGSAGRPGQHEPLMLVKISATTAAEISKIADTVFVMPASMAQTNSMTPRR